MRSLLAGPPRHHGPAKLQGDEGGRAGSPRGETLACRCQSTLLGRAEWLVGAL